MGATRLCFLLFCLFLVKVSAIFNRLNNVDDLKNVGYGRPAPRHGLQMLFWFAQQVSNIDQHGILTLDSNFDPTRGDFGFQYYGKKENFLPKLSEGRRYFSVGDLNSPKANALPAYVQKHRNVNVPESNMDRLIVSVEQNHPNRVYDVYITALKKRSNDFDRDVTHKIHSDLIKYIIGSRECILNHANHYAFYTVDEEDTDNTCLQFLEKIGYNNNFCKYSSDLRKNLKDVPQNSNSAVCYEPEISHASRMIPTKIKGFDASLQLYAKDGKACARLYIKKTFSNWKTLFYNAWVGFYADADLENKEYSIYEYVVNFEVEGDNTHDYKIFEYHSSLEIASGLQIRFLLLKYYSELARTTPWEDTEDVIISPLDCDNPKHKISTYSLYWFAPEFFYSPEFDNACRVIPTKIKGFDASLQLFTKNGKACARLYFKKSFCTWQEDLDKSWVGFYKSNDINYYTYQYAVYFEKVKEDKGDFDIYEYQSSLAIAHGVQIRFFQYKSESSKLAQTPRWMDF